MKKVIFISLFGIWYLVFGILNVYAANSTPSASGNSVEQQIDELKDRIASRVAQLNLVEKRGIMGTATDVSDTELSLTDIQDNTRFVDVDELTKFSNPSVNGSFGISDIKKGMTLGILGLYNKQSRRILAREIDVVDIPEKVHGFVATVDSDNYVINVATDDNKQIQISVDTSTKTLSWDWASQKLIRSGFSKITAGEKIFTKGDKDSKTENMIDASLIIVFPDINKNPAPLTSPSITPSTGSGKKLTPITR